MIDPDAEVGGPTTPEDIDASTYFSGLTPEGRRELVAFFGPRLNIADGTTVCHEGTPADSWWVVLSGTADVTVDGAYVTTIGPGEIVGDVSLLDGGWRSATVTAREQLVLAELGAGTFERFLDEVPGFERALLRQMAARLRTTTRRPRGVPTTSASPSVTRPLPDDLLSVLADPAFYQSPHPYYAALREEDRIRWDEALELWFVSRYDDVRFILRDRRFANDPSTASPTAMLTARAELDEEMGSSGLITHRDGSEHQRLRRLFSQILTPKRVDGLRSEVRETVHEMLDRGRERGELDFVDEIAVPLPTHTISRLLGLPRGDEHLLHMWSVDLASVSDPILDPSRRAKVIAAGQSMRAYLADQFALRRTDPAGDALGELLELAPSCGVSDADLLNNTMLMYIAGHTTTSALIASGGAALTAAPDQWQRLRDEPGLVPNAVEEFLRFDAPVPFSRRYALEDVEIGPVTIGAGQSAAVCLSSANRDPRQFGGDADALRVARRGAHEHLAFAAGRHFCIGAGLARLEAQVTFEAMIHRWERLEALEPVVWRESFVARLPVALRLRAG